MNRPTDDAPCGFCNHKFGEHYESYDGKKSGCAWSYEDQRDGKAICKCKFFAEIKRYSQQSSADGRGDAYVQQWDR